MVQLPPTTDDVLQAFGEMMKEIGKAEATQEILNAFSGSMGASGIKRNSELGSYHRKHVKALETRRDRHLAKSVELKVRAEAMERESLKCE